MKLEMRNPCKDPLGYEYPSGYEMCKAWGINPQTYRYRKETGWDDLEALEDKPYSHKPRRGIFEVYPEAERTKGDGTPRGPRGAIKEEGLEMKETTWEAPSRIEVELTKEFSEVKEGMKKKRSYSVDNETPNEGVNNEKVLEMMDLEESEESEEKFFMNIAKVFVTMVNYLTDVNLEEKVSLEDLAVTVRTLLRARS